MGDLDFDVRITTEHPDPSALMLEVGHAMAHGTFRAPGRLAATGALELVVAVRSGAIAFKGKAEVVGYEGGGTWLRFLSAGGDSSASANLVLGNVSVELGERYRRRDPTAAPSPRPPAAPARITKTHAAPRVVSVPPKLAPPAMPTADGRLELNEGAAPRRGFVSHDALPEAAPPLARRVPPMPPPGPRGTKVPPLERGAAAPSAVPVQTSDVPTARIATDPSKLDALASDRPKLDARPADAPKLDAPKLDARPADAPKLDARPADAPKLDALAEPLPPPPRVETERGPDRDVPALVAPAPLAPPAPPALVAPMDPRAAPRPRGDDPFRHSDSVARLSTAPIDATHDHARAYSAPTGDPSGIAPVPVLSRPPLGPRERRMLGASVAIAACGLFIGGSAVWWALGRSASGPAAGPSTAAAATACAPTEAAPAKALPAAAAIAAPLLGAPPSEPQCSLDVSSNAAAAEIWIDGEKKGSVPARIAVPCRPTQISLRHPRYVADSRQVTPTDGVTEVAMRLGRPLVTLKIQSTPPGATVRVNGKEIGKAPTQTKVYAFERGTVVLSHDGGAIKTMQIYPQADNTVITAVVPKPKPKPKAKPKAR